MHIFWFFYPYSHFFFEIFIISLQEVDILSERGYLLVKLVYLLLELEHFMREELIVHEQLLFLCVEGLDLPCDLIF